MPNLNDLKGFLDLGGIFILALVLLYVFSTKFDKMDGRLDKIITLLALLVNSSGHKDKLADILDDKELTNFNDVK
jgi:hypothetical protein